MLYIQNLLQNIVTAHENIRAKLPNKARFGIIAFLAVISFIILIFKAEWLMANMVALLPVFYVAAVLAVGLKRALYGTAIFLFFCFALWLRVGPPHQGVLGGSYVLFGENDGWYHMRLIENLISHFPRQITFDPYTYYPYGQELYFAPLFDWLVALFIWIAGLGHPSIELAEKMAAYFPTLLGALTIIPVYFIGKELFNRNFGLIVAGLLAIAPGEFLFRSLLGFTDHHILETLLSTIIILLLILAIKRARETKPTFGHIKNKEWSALKKPLIYSLLTGFVLGLYLLSWVGGLLFVLIIFVYLTVQYIIDHLRGDSTDYLCIIGLPIFLLPLIMFGPFWKDIAFGKYAIISLPIAILTPVALSAVSRLMQRYSLRRLYYPLVVAVLAFAAAGILHLINPSFFNSAIAMLGLVFTTNATNQTIMEAQPLLSGFNISTLMEHRVWSYFTVGIILAPIAFLQIAYSSFSHQKIGRLLFFGLIALVILTVILDQLISIPWQLYLTEFVAAIAAYSYFEKSAIKTLLIIWSAVVLLAMLGQTRFAYYFAVNVALLSGYILWKMPVWISFVFKFTSKSWIWLTGWIALIIVTLIVDKTTFISVPSILYIVEGIAAISWIAYKILYSSSEPKIKSVADKRKARAAKKLGEVTEDHKTFRYFNPTYLSGILSVIVIFSLTVYPNLIYGTYNSSECSPKNSATLYLPYHPYGPNGDWYEALTWMRSINSSTGELNTPDPFGEDALYINGSFYGNSFYYSLYEKPADGDYDYPDSAYGVMSWWDYGHWITRIAHRLPNANPHQHGIGGPGPNGSVIPGASIFMTAQDEATASWVMDELDSRYVVIDYETAWPKYHTMITWSGKNPSDFYENWYRESNGELRWYENPDPKLSPEIQLFYPAYYQSMCARLYNFGTKAVVPNNSTWVLSYTWQTTENGERYKLLTDVANNQTPFATYEEAAAFINDHPEYVIVGTNPFVSPIPLEALQEYKLIHSSPNPPWEGFPIPYVEIFEYTGYKK